MLHLTLEQSEQFLEDIDVHSFRRGLEPEEYIKKVAEACSLSEKTKVPVEELPSHVKRMKNESFELGMDTVFKNIERENAQHDLNMIVAKIGEFRILLENLQMDYGTLVTVITQRNDAYAEIWRLRNTLNLRGFGYGNPANKQPTKQIPNLDTIRSKYNMTSS